MIGVFVQKADETTATRYFHSDHLGSIAVITNETGGVVERLSYDAWGLRRHEDGTPDPAGAITSEADRGFTGHEHLAEVGLIHMNGRVYDPLLSRFGTPDPMTENPFSTQGWNRYSYVGNSPVNFTDPSGYCFLGCFWKPLFKAIGNFFRKNWGAILRIAAGAICQPVGLGPVCAAAASAFVAGVTSGDLGVAIRAGITSFITAAAFDAVGTATLGPGHPLPDFMSPAHLANMAGHALVGCVSAVAQRSRCGPGALAAAAGSFAGPILRDLGFQRNLVAHAVVGGVASVAAGGNFANGAVTAAFGYLFNEINVIGDRAPVDAALAYLKRDPGMAALIEMFEGPGGRDVTIDVGPYPESGMLLNPRTDARTIQWDPNGAVIFPDGGSISPALVLGHELGHAAADKDTLLRGYRTRDPEYRNLEERRVIQGLENPAAKTLGESIRLNHYGNPYKVKGPLDR